MHAHDHSHDHGHDHDRGHGHGHAHATGDALVRALLITLGFAAIEAAAGWWAGSLALLSDAGHMVADSGSLGLAAFASWYARRPAGPSFTWGHGRAEVLAALFNVLLNLVIVAGLVYEAIERLHSPPAHIQAGVVLGVAAIGLGLNGFVLRTLSHGPQTLNLRGATLHVLGDMLASAAALLSGAVILATGWLPIDALLSLAICVLIVLSGARLMRDSLNVVMEGVPSHLDLAEIGKSMASTPGVVSVHDLHVWQVHSDQIALSAHVVLRHMNDWMPVLGRLNALLAERYSIRHATLQPEPVPEVALPDPRVHQARR
jgi:cobalt-zinc-cadmium efflux system protein